MLIKKKIQISIIVITIIILSVTLGEANQQDLKPIEELNPIDYLPLKINNLQNQKLLGADTNFKLNDISSLKLVSNYNTLKPIRKLNPIDYLPLKINNLQNQKLLWTDTNFKLNDVYSSRFVDNYNTMKPIRELNSIDYRSMGLDDLQEKQINQFEMDANTKPSDAYIGQLVDDYNMGGNLLMYAGSEANTQVLGQSYNTFGYFQNDAVANYFRSLQGLDPTEVGRQNTQYGFGIYSNVNLLASSVILGMETVQRTGLAMQEMNPPIYLDTITPMGWTGSGYIDNKGTMPYMETLTKSGSNLQRITTIETPFGYSYKKMITPTNKIDSDIVHIFPLGNSYDPVKTTGTYQYGYGATYNIVNGEIKSIQPIQSPNTYQSNIPMNFPH